MPKPTAMPKRASGTARAKLRPDNCRMDSTRPKNPAAQPACPAESCPPLVLMGKVPSVENEWRRMNSGPSPLSAKTEILELNDRHHRVVVIGFDKVDVGRGRLPRRRISAPDPEPSRRASESDRPEMHYAVRTWNAPPRTAGRAPARAAAS